VISANITGRTLNLGGASTNANTISGAMNNSGGFGDFAVSKADAGTWILSGDNSYTGLTSISAGTLRFGHANAIGGSGGLTVSGSATIDNSSGSALVMNNVGTVTLSNNLTFGGTNALTINSAVNQTADLTVTMNGTGGLTLGNYTNTSAANRILNVNNANGTLTFGNVALSNNANSYNLRIGNNGGSNGRLTITGVISDGGTATASSLTIGGGGAGNIVTLSNDNTYRGGTNLSSGTLNMNHAGALGDGTLTINSGVLNNTSGSAIVNSNNNAQAWNGDFTFTGTNNLDLGTGDVTLGGTRQVTVNGGELTVGGVISGTGFQLRKAGNNGYLTLTGASSYTGNTLVTAGRLYLNHTATSNPAILGNVSLSSGSNTARPFLYLLADNQLESTALVSASISGGNTTYTDFVLGGRSQTIAGYSASGAVGSGTNYIENRPFGDVAGGNGVLTINNSSTVTLGGGTGSNRVNVRDGGSGTLALVKDGAGTLIFNLNGADYTGGFTMKSGLVQVAGTAFGASTPVKFEGGTLSSGDTTARSFGSGNAISLDGNVTFGDATNNGKLTFAGAGTLTGNRVLTIASDVEFSGAIGQDVAGRTLTKSGSATLTLSGTNTYTGATTVSGGVLAVNGSLGNSATTVGNSAVLQGSGSIGGSVTIQAGGTIATGNSIESLATGALSLEALATFAYEINNDAEAGLAGDLTAVTGGLDLDLGNLANLTLGELGGGSWSANEKLTLISYTGAWNGGLFRYNGSTLANNSTFSFSGTDWRFQYDDSLAGDNFTDDLTGTSFVTMTAVPEPRAALLASLGLLALLRRRRAA
jgi:autotransporter-associated beta strand protein